MRRFFFILQILLKSFLLYLIAFIWLKFILDSFWLASILSFAITLFLNIIGVIINKKKNLKSSLKIKEKEDAESMFLSLINDNHKVDFFYKLFISRFNNVVKYKDSICVEKEEHKIIIYPFFRFQNPSQDDIVFIHNHCKKYKANKILILCNEYDKSLVSFCDSFDCQILLLNKYETYSCIYKEYDFYPTITTKKKNSKHSFKQILSILFNKQKTKGYFISALVLFIASLFINLNIYYCIFASLLLIFALISLIMPNHNSKKYTDII